jgi:hypothetical protein
MMMGFTIIFACLQTRDEKRETNLRTLLGWSTERTLRSSAAPQIGGCRMQSNDSVANSKSVWYVRFNDGNASVEHRFSTAVVRLVHETAPVATRTRATASKERFIPSDDGTEITDIMTGLVWRRCAEGLQWNNASKTCDGIETKFVWKDALDYAKANGAGGWRMPSIKELFSVVDVTKQAPAIDTIAFPGTSPGGFFSTTPINVQGNVYVKYVSFFDGYIFQQSMYGDPLSIRMVRRGRK